MLRPYRQHHPVLVATIAVAVAIVAFVLATSVVFSIIGWAFDAGWFVVRLAVVAALIGVGIACLRRVSR